MLFDFAVDDVGAVGGDEPAEFLVGVGEEDDFERAGQVFERYELHVPLVLRDGAGAWFAAGDGVTAPYAAMPTLSVAPVYPGPPAAMYP